VKVLQLSARLPYPLTDGGAMGIYHLARSVAFEGHDVTFLSFPSPDPKETKEAIAAMSQFCRVQLVSKALPGRVPTLIRTTFRGAYPIERRMMPEMYRAIEELLTKEKFDVVHLDHSHVGKYGLWIKQKFGIPVVLRQHNFETLLYDRFAEQAPNVLTRTVARVHAKRLRIEETTILRGVDAVAAITEEDVVLMRQVAPNAKYSVVPAGVDTDFFQPTSQDQEVENKILWVGGLDWEPNLDGVTWFLKEIFPRIHRSIPEVRMDIVGSGGDRVEQVVTQYQGRIRILGRVPDIREHLAVASVMVVPLRIGGGMRLKLLDFFASGKAVVSTRIGAEGNAATDSAEVLLRDEPEAFARAVVDLLRNREQRAALGKLARRLVEARYSWNRVGEMLVAVYQKAIEEHHKN
jgi:glycosyltransferase involved in cell wall biosynthesis